MKASLSIVLRNSTINITYWMGQVYAFTHLKIQNILEG